MHPALIAVLSVIGGLLFIWLVVFRIVRKVHPMPIPAPLVRLIDNPFRRRLFSAARTLEQTGIREGMRAFEVGPGTGFLSSEAARRLGGDGRLYCVDVEPQVIALLRRKTLEVGADNVSLVVGDAVHLPFRDETLDMSFLVTVLGEIPDKHGALRELHRVLRPDGTLSVSELLPDPDYCLKSTTVALAAAASFEPLRASGNLFAYVVNFRKRDGAS
ncbi:MAG: methyltransferase domain-containing protein [Chloroflexota bacterium]|nr:methyltransferase domain-containing protein [Chloroflexota bacterium]